MNDRLKEAFDQIRAEEELKDKTRTFLAQKTKGYARRRLSGYQQIMSAAACFLFLFISSRWFYFTPTAKISIDVNPSIELGINRLDRVIAVDTYNDDGRELAEMLNIRHLSYEEAVSQILESERVRDLLSKGEVATITVIESQGGQSVRILSDMQSCAAGHRNTYCYSADSSDVAEAHEHGMSCGKYRAFLELQTLCPGITADEIQSMTMREIQDLIDALLIEAGREAVYGEDRKPGGQRQRRHRHDGGRH